MSKRIIEHYLTSQAAIAKLHTALMAMQDRIDALEARLRNQDDRLVMLAGRLHLLRQPAGGDL